MLKKNYLIYLLSFTALVLLILIIKLYPERQKLYTSNQIEQIITHLYQDENGFSISGAEREFIEKSGGNPTYGEILPSSLALLLEKLNLSKNDTLFDLGSGAGKVCIQVALTTPARAVGIELSATRHALAHQMKEKLIDAGILADPNKLEFIEGNIKDYDLGAGTVFFMCSTCFSDELMKELTNQFLKIPHTIKIISLRELPLDQDNEIRLIDTLNLAMSWSEGSSVYVYQKI